MVSQIRLFFICFSICQSREIHLQILRRAVFVKVEKYICKYWDKQYLSKSRNTSANTETSGICQSQEIHLQILRRAGLSRNGKPGRSAQSTARSSWVQRWGEVGDWVHRWERWLEHCCTLSLTRRQRAIFGLPGNPKTLSRGIPSQTPKKVNICWTVFFTDSQ